MPDPVTTGIVQTTVAIIKAAADDPAMRAAGHEVAKAAHTIAKTINVGLLPLVLVNNTYEKARDYLADKFPQEMAEKAASIPVEDLVDPKPSIAGPAMQALVFAHEEPNLKELYLNLLKTTMDGRVSGNAHPSFVEIIKQLDPEEARFLRGVLQSDVLPIVEIRLKEGPNAWKPIRTHLLDLAVDAVALNVDLNGLIGVIKRLPAMVDNWIRLGLCSIAYDKYLPGEHAYDWVESQLEVIAWRQRERATPEKVTIQKGVLIRTSLGKQFAGSVGILAAEESKPEPAREPSGAPDIP